MQFLSKIPSKKSISSKEENKNTMSNIHSVYDIKINTLQNKPLDLNTFKEKYLLFVNVASKCGFTGQYKDLQKLYDGHKHHLEIIGVPCNQFGGQEPGDADSISAFCERNYGVSFTMTEKINVKGSEKHPLYQWLTRKEYNGKMTNFVKWNFQKYLVDPNGKLIDVFYSITKPTSSKITKHLK